MQRINNSMPLVTTTSSPPDPSQARGKISKRANAYYVKSIEPLELERIIVIFPDYADPNPPIVTSSNWCGPKSLIENEYAYNEGDKKRFKDKAKSSLKTRARLLEEKARLSQPEAFGLTGETNPERTELKKSKPCKREVFSN